MATYIGKTISLISKAGIRYEGILYTIDPSKSTVALSKVKSFGTETRPVDRFIPSRDEIFEYIIFRGSDIQDLSVCENSLYNEDSCIVKIGPQNSINTEEPHDKSVKSNDDRVFLNSSYHQINESPLKNIKSENNYSHNENTSDFKYDNTSKSESIEKDELEKVAKNDYQTFINREHNTYRRGWGNNRGSRGGRGGTNSGYQSGVFGLPRNNKSHGNPSNNRNSEVPKSDFDFEFSNSLIADELAHINIEEGTENNQSEVEGVADKIYYDKQKSFFDNISSERQQQNQDQRRNDRQLNCETFGGDFNRDTNYRRGGGNYSYRGGFSNRGGNYRRGYNNYGRGGFSYRGNSNYRGFGQSQQHGFIRRGGAGSSNWRRGGAGNNVAMAAGFASDSSYKRGGLKMPGNGAINVENSASAVDAN